MTSIVNGSIVSLALQLPGPDFANPPRPDKAGSEKSALLAGRTGILLELTGERASTPPPAMLMARRISQHLPPMGRDAGSGKAADAKHERAKANGNL